MTEQNPIALLSERFTELEQENDYLREGLADVRASLGYENRGWTLIGGLSAGQHLEGLELEELKEIAEIIRPHVAGDGLIKRGADLHTGYVLSKGVNIEGLSDSPERKTPGAKPKLRRFFENPVNQDNLFSPSAEAELQKARYTDGNVFLVCDTVSQTVRRIPLNQITGMYANPDFPEEVWAYKRTWNSVPGQSRDRWYYTSRFTGRKLPSLEFNGKRVKVEPNSIVVDRRFNRQVGFTLGIPDAVAAMPWAAAYSEVMKYGRVVNESLAKILFKITSKTPKGAKSAGVKVSQMSGNGNTASLTEGSDVQAVSTAGKGYDFVSARPLAAMAAAALNVSNMELLSDSSAAGSSYGSAQALTPATKNAMRLMQSEWIEMFREVFSVMGLGRPRVWFEPLDDVDPYRAAQALTILSVALTDEEYRARALDYLDITGDSSFIPELLANRGADVDVQAASPDQGQSNGSSSGGQGANDLRSDGIPE